MKIQTALDKTLSVLKFGKSYGGYQDKWVRISLGLPVGVWIPNFEQRVRTVKVHDVYHVLTGYRALDLKGELEESFFELGAGCGKFYFAWAINAFALPLIFVAPVRCLRAFRRGRNSKSLYRHFHDFADVHSMEIEEVRRALHIA